MVNDLCSYSFRQPLNQKTKSLMVTREGVKEMENTIPPRYTDHVRLPDAPLSLDSTDTPRDRSVWRTGRVVHYSSLLRSNET